MLEDLPPGMVNVERRSWASSEYESGCGISATRYAAVDVAPENRAHLSKGLIGRVDLALPAVISNGIPSLIACGAPRG